MKRKPIALEQLCLFQEPLFHPGDRVVVIRNPLDSERWLTPKGKPGTVEYVGATPDDSVHVIFDEWRGVSRFGMRVPADCIAPVPQNKYPLEQLGQVSGLVLPQQRDKTDE
jgi:hypothetical protein